MRKLFKERKLFKGGNYMRKYGKFFCIWGIFGQTVSTHFGTVSPLSIFSIIFIWDLDLDLGCKELGI